jgi:hypothetical protein
MTNYPQGSRCSRAPGSGAVPPGRDPGSPAPPSQGPSEHRQAVLFAHSHRQRLRPAGRVRVGDPRAIQGPDARGCAIGDASATRTRMIPWFCKEGSVAMNWTTAASRARLPSRNCAHPSGKSRPFMRRKSTLKSGSIIPTPTGRPSNSMKMLSSGRHARGVDSVPDGRAKLLRSLRVHPDLDRYLEAVAAAGVTAIWGGRCTRSMASRAATEKMRSSR